MKRLVIMCCCYIKNVSFLFFRLSIDICYVPPSCASQNSSTPSCSDLKPNVSKAA